MSLSWTHRIAKALACERPSPALELHLDALLVWLSNPDNPRAAELDHAIVRQRLTREAAGASAYRLLDQQLFAGEDPPAPEMLGLDPGAPAALAKQRYRRLVQAYHPDRHPERTHWATRRTEQINLAFAALQQGASGTAKAGPRRTQPRSASRPVPRRSRRLPPDWLPAPLRDSIAPAWLWAHARLSVLSALQQRMLSMAALVVVLLLTITLWPEAPPKPAPRIIHHPLGITPPPAPVVAPEPEREPPPPAPIRQIAAAATPTVDPEVPPPDGRSATRTPDEAPPQVSRVTTPGDEPLSDDASNGSSVAQQASTPESLPQPLQVAPAEPSAAPPLTGYEASALPPAASTLRTPPAGSDSGTPPAPHLGIPAAAVPEPPTPPRSPEAPPVPSTAPTLSSAQPATLAAAPITSRCQNAPEILNRFRNAYQNGALDPLMALYSPQAKENELATWFAIRQTYAEWFDTTSARRIDFEQTQVQPIADSRRCALMAVFQVSYLDRQARLVTQAGIIEMLLEPQGADWMILRARY